MITATSSIEGLLAGIVFISYVISMAGLVAFGAFAGFAIVSFFRDRRSSLARMRDRRPGPPGPRPAVPPLEHTYADGSPYNPPRSKR